MPDVKVGMNLAEPADMQFCVSAGKKLPNHFLYFGKAKKGIIMTTKMLFSFLILLRVIFILPPETTAEPLQLATWEIPSWVIDKNSGRMIEIVKEIKKRTGIQFEIRLYPPKRSVKMFKDNEVIGMFPAMETNIPKEAAKSEPYMYKTIYALTKKEKPDISGLEDLNGMKVGLVSGYSYPKSITENKNLITDYASRSENNVKKLIAGRIDVYPEERNTLVRLINEMGLQKELKISEKPVCELTVCFAFQLTEEGKKLAENFSEAILEMKKDGTLEKLLSGIQN